MDQSACISNLSHGKTLAMELPSSPIPESLHKWMLATAVCGRRIQVVYEQEQYVIE